MREVSVDQLQGGEYLAKPVKLNDNRTLYYEGTCLYMKHIETLIAAGVEMVSIFETSSSLTPKEKMVIRENLRSDCSLKVKKVLEGSITVSDGLEEIAETASEIIDEVYSSEEIVDHVYDIRERNASLYDHCVTVATFSILTALKMNLSKWEVYDIGVGSLIHDMGLRYLSVNYQDVDVNDFEPDMLFEYKKHTLYGFSSVEKESWMSNEAKKIILYHHERIDGSGYPFKQKAVTLGTRIVAIVDAFDDSICGIGCKKKNIREAIQFIKDGRDILFEGRIVDYFLGFIAAYPVGTIVITNRGDEAIVIEQNEHYTDKPKIKLIQDRDGKPYADDEICDLVEDSSIYIDCVKEQ